MKGLALLLVILLLPAVCFPQANSLACNFPAAAKSLIQQAKVDHAVLLLDDDITMDKSYTSIRYELVYLGAENNVANFKHNEYLSDDYGFFSKPGYSQNISCNLNESNIIDYKGLKIEVLRASPQGLKYRILTENEDQEYILSKLVKP